MRKFISFLLVFIIAFSGFPIAMAFSESEELTLTEYAEQLSELTQMYDISNIGGINGENIDLVDIPLNRLIIKTNNNQKFIEDCNAIAKIEGYNGIHIMQYTSEYMAEQAYNYYSGLSNVESVEFDFCFNVAEPVPEPVEYKYDKEYLSWGATAIKTNDALTYATYFEENAPEIVVAVIDTGIDYNHEFLRDRIVDSGVDLVEYDGVPDDDNSHGTHVAGIIVDNTAENVKVSAYKVLDSKGIGFYSTICAAVDLSIEHKVDIINMSLSGPKSLNAFGLFEECINKAISNDIPVIVAAGNDECDASNVCPASNTNVITVASSTDYNAPSSFSNFGECVDVAAPGSRINSCIKDNLYGSTSGTSMATPFVSAAAAFLKTLNPSYSPKTIKRIIKENVFVPKNWDTKYGTGILDFSVIVKECIAEKPKIFINKDKKAEIYTVAENADIYYTTDGSKPIIGVSAIYKEPIDISDAVSINAIVCEKDKYPSILSTLRINWQEKITIRYKGTKNMRLSSNAVITSCYSSDENVAVADKSEKTIYGVSEGGAIIVVNLETGQKITYIVTVEYELWQLVIIYFFFGFWWYI